MPPVGRTNRAVGSLTAALPATHIAKSSAASGIDMAQKGYAEGISRLLEALN